MSSPAEHKPAVRRRVTLSIFEAPYWVVLQARTPHRGLDACRGCMSAEGNVHRVFSRLARDWLSLLPLRQLGGHIDVIQTDTQLTALRGAGSGMKVVKANPIRSAE